MPDINLHEIPILGPRHLAPKWLIHLKKFSPIPIGAVMGIFGGALGYLLLVNVGLQGLVKFGGTGLVKAFANYSNTIINIFTLIILIGTIFVSVAIMNYFDRWLADSIIATTIVSDYQIVGYQENDASVVVKMVNSRGKESEVSLSLNDVEFVHNNKVQSKVIIKKNNYYKLDDKSAIICDYQEPEWRTPTQVKSTTCE